MLLDKTNKCIKHWKDLDHKDNHAKQVLDYIKALKLIRNDENQLKTVKTNQEGLDQSKHSQESE